MDLTDEQIRKALKGCRHNKREAQKELYRSYFGYAMEVAFRYSRDYNMAVDIINDAFLKIYFDLKNLVPRIDNTNASFKLWLKNTVFNTCMEDKNHSNKKQATENAETNEVLVPCVYKTA